MNKKTKSKSPKPGSCCTKDISIHTLEHRSWSAEVKHMETELSGTYTSHSWKQDSSTSQAIASVTGSAFSMCSYPYKKNFRFAYSHWTVAFFSWEHFKRLLAKRIKVVEQKIAFFYIQTDKIGPSVKNSFEHLIKTHPRNPTFCRDVPKLSSSSRIFWRAMCNALPTFFPVCNAKAANQIWDICLLTGRQLSQNISFWQIFSL